MSNENLTLAFLICDGNDLYHAVLSTCLLSSVYLSPRDSKKGVLKGQGVLMYKENLENIRRTIIFFSVRSLPKHTWVTSNDLLIGRE